MNHLTMIEFPTVDAASSAEFFRSAFGWPHLSYGPHYTDVLLGQGQTLGFQQDAAEAPGGPLAIIEVEDLDDAMTAVQAAHGTITVPPFDFPGGRRFHLREPGGNELAAWVRATSQSPAAAADPA